MPTASSRKAQSAHAWRAFRGQRNQHQGDQGAGNRCQWGRSFRMMPDRQVSTTVSAMFAEKRDPRLSGRESRPLDPGRRRPARARRGRLVLAETPVRKGRGARRRGAGPAAAEGKVKNPIIAPDDIDPNLSATEQVATLVGTPRFESLFVPDDFVKKVVATVDSLARQDIAARMNPASPWRAGSRPRARAMRLCSAQPISRAMHRGSSSWIHSMPTRRRRSTSGSTRNSRGRTRISAIPTVISMTG